MYMPPIPWETLRGAPTGELAHLLLLNLLKGNGRNLTANNLLAGARLAQQDANAPLDAEALVDRMSDAWAWLVAHGYLGPEPQQVDAQYLRVTEAGKGFGLDKGGVARVWAEDRLTGDVDPALATARLNLAMGEYETAAFAAMKAVEVAVRDASELGSSVIGVNLMRKAFSTKDPGSLCDTHADGGEQQAHMDLFAGAIGTFKNPASHRSVTFEDPVEVAEIVQLADLLLRIVRRRSGGANQSGG